MSDENRIPVIICGGSQGRAVVFGWVDEIPQVEQPCELRAARMIMRWGGTAGLLGLAANGPSGNASTTRITSAVPLVRDTPRQVLVVTARAAEAIGRWPDAE